jgi:hypothetical protein
MGAVEFESPHPCRREPSGLLPTRRWSPGTDLTQESSWSRSGQGRAPSFSPAVPPACHKQRAPAVSSGQSRSLRGGRRAGHQLLTWGKGGGRNCMACKRSRARSSCRRRLSKPQRRRGRLHGLVDHGQRLGPQHVQVHLIAQVSAERLDSPGRIVAAAVEAPVDRLLLAGAPGRLPGRLVSQVRSLAGPSARVGLGVGCQRRSACSHG